MKKRLLITVSALGLLGLLIAAALLLLYAAAQRVPAGYRQAMEADQTDRAAGSGEMLRKSSMLASDIENQDEWSALFTVEEINGWLAVDLVNNYPETLPRAVRDPRVEISPDQITLYCRFDHGQFQSVLSLSVKAYLHEPNVVALRICGARAGVLPLPRKDVLDQITEAARRMNLRLRWRQTQSDPVALLTVLRAREDGKHRELEDLRMGEGELYFAGSTRER